MQKPKCDSQCEEDLNNRFVHALPDTSYEIVCSGLEFRCDPWFGCFAIRRATCSQRQRNMDSRTLLLSVVLLPLVFRGISQAQVASAAFPSPDHGVDYSVGQSIALSGKVAV